jgi:2-haloacid dehalogenase
VAITALLFDVYGTLLDVHGLTGALERVAPGRGAEFSALWRTRQIDYTRLRTLSGRYADFGQVTAEALDYAAEKLGVPLGAARRADLLAAYETLPAHPDARPALTALSASGLRLGALSNGTPPMLARALGAADLAPLLPLVLSVDAVKAYKTAPAAYRLGTESLGLPASDIGFVSSNGWDIAGATWFGFRTFWVNRGREPLERLGVAPEASGESLADLVAWLDATAAPAARQT